MDDLLSGRLGYLFLISILDAALLSWLALRLYSRSVRRLMRERAPQTAVDAAPERPSVPSSSLTEVDATPSLGIALFEAPPTGPTNVPVPTEQRAQLRRLAVAYCVGAAVHSAVITVAQFSAQAPTLPFVAWFGRWWINTWPIVPTLVALLVLDRRIGFRLAAAYLLIGSAALGLITLAGQVARGVLNDAPLTNVYWLIVGLVGIAWVPLLLILATGWRRIRAVTPLAFAATLLFGFALMFFNEAMNRALNLTAVRTAVLDLAVLTSSEGAYYGLFMLVSLPVGWLAWQLLQGLAVSFERKQFSDVQLVVDCWWFIVTADAVTDLSLMYGVGAIPVGLAAFVAYRLGVALTLRRLKRQPDVPPRRLLLLRVFGYEARTESLFDSVAQRWRFHGPVQLIAGVDLATRAADPGDMLAFIRGQLSAQYIAAPPEVPQRLQRLDLARDPDGRFRVNELYCHDDTWRPTLAALLDMSDTVLMDLRSFCERNAGCVFELEQLVHRVSTNSVVLVCDRNSDLRLLGKVLGQAWDVARGERPAQGTGQIALVRVERHSRRELSFLMQCLLGARTPYEVLAPAELPASLA